MDCENVYTVSEVQSIESSSNFEWLATAPEMKVAQVRRCAVKEALIQQSLRVPPRELVEKQGQ
jgi:hypothetical protein